MLQLLHYLSLFYLAVDLRRLPVSVSIYLIRNCAQRAACVYIGLFNVAVGGLFFN